ncbi:MAG: EAL domain-containing protein [Aquificae bacterium]|nr:EAL domain-containing protein [Aquificota bacterium]
MATNKPILSVIVEKRLKNKLKKYAKERKVSLSKIASYFIQKGIECEEKGLLENISLSILNLFPELIWIKDNSLKYKYANKRFLEFFGIDSITDILDKPNIDFLDEEMAKTCIYGDMRAINTKEPYTSIEIFDKNGDKYYLEVTKVPIKDEKGDIIGILGIARDTTQEIYIKEKLKETQDKLNSLLKESSSACNIDCVTQLPNRAGFLEIISKRLPEIRKLNLNGYIVLIDIYNFKYFNKIYGIEMGNLYLRKAAKELQYFFKRKNIKYILGKTGEDEFSVLIEGNINIKTVVKQMKNLLQHVYLKDSTGNTIRIPSISLIGCKLSPNGDIDAENLLIQLEVELSKRKNTVHKEPLIVSQGMITKGLENERLLYNAIQNKNIVPYLQGIYSLKNKHLLGYEVFFRVKHNKKIIEAKDFIFTAYATGLILFIDKAILREINQIKHKISTRLFVNLSYLTVYQCETSSKDFVDLLIDLRENTSFEIPESDFLENLKVIKDVANRYNLDMVFDNFGEKHCPIKLMIDLYNDKIVSMLKFDKHLIKSIADDKKNESLVKTIVELSKEFGIKTVAMGVEDKKLYEKVKALDIDYCQGYFLEVPRDLKEIIAA